MEKLSIKSIGALFALIMLQGTLFAQGLQSTLFDEVSLSMGLAKQAQADVLSPQAFEEGMNNYKAAKKEYDGNGELSDIKAKIAKSNSKFQEAIENAKVSSVMFSSALSARRDALNAEADNFRKEMWLNAEEEMKEAAEKLEKGDANKAKEKSMAATDLYRKVELESIKANYLTNAKKLLEKAEDDKVYKEAPKTIAEAKSLVNKAEKELLDNRYDTDNARYLAKEAEYKALLAIYIAKQARLLDDKDYETEDYLLRSYEPINQIGQSLNLNLKFAEGVEGPVAEIKNRIAADHMRIASLESSVFNYKMRNENLMSMQKEQQYIIANMNGKLSDEAMKGQQRQIALQSQIDRMEDINEKFENVQQIFGKEEAQVFRQKDNVIIRMIGVNFDVGQAVIKQEDYKLLTNVQKAMNLFTDASIAIEGHTDSQGGDELNLKLSQERADAVLSYLNANSAVDESRFSTKGFGESRPIANNETLAGRKMNRRIDIVIKPTTTVALLGSIPPAKN